MRAGLGEGARELRSGTTAKRERGGSRSTVQRREEGDEPDRWGPPVSERESGVGLSVSARERAGERQAAAGPGRRPTRENGEAGREAGRPGEFGPKGVFPFSKPFSILNSFEF